MGKRREIDIFGVLLGIVIGCILGFFLSTRINIRMPNELGNDEVGKVFGNIYLLQIAKTETAEEVSAIISNLRTKQLNSVYVKDGPFYYVYGGIAANEAALTVNKIALENEGYNPIIKREYILDMANSVLDEELEYKYWQECIMILLEHLEGKVITITDDFHNNPICLDVYVLVVALQTVKKSSLKEELLLNIYQEIIKNLG